MMGDVVAFSFCKSFSVNQTYEKHIAPVPTMWQKGSILYLKTHVFRYVNLCGLAGGKLVWKIVHFSL